MSGKSQSRRSGSKHPAHRSDYFVTVVDFAPAIEADGAFRAWLQAHHLHRDDLSAEDVYVETDRTELGLVRRYRMHWDAIPR